MQTAPRITLTNGVTVANFSSPHDFTFVDGTILPKCDDFRSNFLKLIALEDKVDGIKGTTDIKI